MKYKFVHIPKTGGSYFLHVCKKFDLPVLFGVGHQFICSNKTDYRNITIIRDPAERFISAYNQYIHGTSEWGEDQKTPLPLGPETILDLTYRGLLTEKILQSNFVYAIHFKKQISWVRPAIGRNTILVYYSDSLRREIQELCDFLRFDVNTLNDNRVNYPLGKELTPESLPKKIKDKINFVYKQDYDLFYNIDRNRKAFYKVIGDIDGQKNAM